MAHYFIEIKHIKNLGIGLGSGNKLLTSWTEYIPSQNLDTRKVYKTFTAQVKDCVMEVCGNVGGGPIQDLG